jgi:hypothetical protein
MFEGLSVDHDDKFAMLPKRGVEVLLIFGERILLFSLTRFARRFRIWNGMGIFMRLKALDTM